MVDVITVSPADTGWAVKSSSVENPMMFLSGAKAEASARRLAANITMSGVPAEIRIFTRDGALAGRYACPALEARAF